MPPGCSLWSSCSTTFSGPTRRRCSSCSSWHPSWLRHPCCSSPPRNVEIEKDHPLVGTLARLAPLPVTRRILVEGLGEDDVAQFMEATTGGVERGVAAAVHHRTQGNPFFVQEVVRLLTAEGQGRVDDSGLFLVTAIPTVVRDVV